MFEKKKNRVFEEGIWREMGEIQGLIIQQRIAIEQLKKSIEELKELYLKEGA